MCTFICLKRMLRSHCGRLQGVIRSPGRSRRSTHRGVGRGQELLTRLRKVVDSLGSDWEGAGAGAFNDLYLEFNTAGGQLTEALDGIASLLSKAAGYYAESETNVANAFRR